MVGNGAVVGFEYLGTKSVTASGYTCKMWNMTGLYIEQLPDGKNIIQKLSSSNIFAK
jgi:hypothetical protein